MGRSQVSFRQYVHYVAVACAAFASTVGCRELLQRLIGQDSVALYTLSMALAYAIGIVVNFLLQRLLTFRTLTRSWRMFHGFVLVAAVGAAVTLVSSLCFRYLLFDFWIQRWSPTLGFVCGNVVASVSTYLLNATYVFPPGNINHGSAPASYSDSR